MKKIRAIYWDLDGTLYRYHPEASYLYGCLVARAARALGATETEKQIIEHHIKVVEAHHYPESLKNNGEFDRHRYHHLIQDGLDVDIMVEEVDGVREAFASSRLPHALITHGSKPWAKRALGKLGLREYFSDEWLFGFEDFDFHGKEASAKAYLQVLNQLGHKPDEVAMIEDSPRNLVHAHAIGMTTILLNHGKPLAELPSHVDAQCFHVAEVLERLEKPARRRVLTPHCA